MKRPLLALIALLATPGILAAQGVPLGPEFRVNTYTTNYQVVRSVASDSAGNFVVVWARRNQDGSGFGVFGQRYASTGAASSASTPTPRITSLLLS